jgi:hypothetical protein
LSPKLYKIKNYKNYTEQEIIELLNQAQNSYQYDYVIDRLFFLEQNTKTKWIDKSLNIKSARRMYEIEHAEKHDNRL